MAWNRSCLSGVALLAAIGAARCGGTVNTAVSGSTSGGSTSSGTGGSMSSSAVSGSTGGGSTTSTAAGSTGSSTSSSSTSASSSGCLAAVPSQHRPTETTCAPSTPPLACMTDTDCMMPDKFGSLLMGKCTASQVCDYDQCHVDGDCTTPGKGVCSCQGQTNGDGNFGSLCIFGNCRTDADCGPNGYCSPSYDITCGAFSGTVGWYCHTCADTCIEQSDCPADPSKGPGHYCAYDPAQGHWTCGYGFCSG